MLKMFRQVLIKTEISAHTEAVLVDAKELRNAEKKVNVIWRGTKKNKNCLGNW